MRNRRVLMTVMATATFVAATHAGIVTSDLVANFDAQTGSNTTSAWEDQQGSNDMAGIDGSAAAATLSLSDVSSSYLISKAYQFDGTVGFDAVPVQSVIDDVSSFEIWMRTNIWGPNASTRLTVFETGANNGLAITIPGNRDKINVNISTSGTPQLVYDVVANPDNVPGLSDPTTDFIQFVVTADSGNGSVLYINGQQVDTGSSASGWNGGNPAGLGIQNDNSTISGDPFEGEIAIFRVYDDILTPAEVLQNYNAMVVPEPAAFVSFLLGGVVALMRRHTVAGKGRCG